MYTTCGLSHETLFTYWAEIRKEVRIGVRARGGGFKGGCGPPSCGKLCNFSGKTLLIRATTLGREHRKIMLLAWFPKVVNKVSS